MELKETLLKRRSCRKYKEEKVSDALIEELMIAAMSGPSACKVTDSPLFNIRLIRPTRLFAFTFLFEGKTSFNSGYLGAKIEN